MDNILLNDKYKVNYRNLADGIDLMNQVKDNVITACFFDPQYRAVLDKLDYGNEGKTKCEGRSSLTQMDEKTIINFISNINRVLVKSGYLFLWIDKFTLCQGIHLNWIKDTTLEIVDLLTWDKGKIGMGYRTRRQAEYLLILQKAPLKAKETWSDHAIADVIKEVIKKEHTHSKPIGLQMQLIEAVSKKGDYILDPASGGFSVFKACRYSGRNFIGGDIEFGEEDEDIEILKQGSIFND